MLQLQAKIPLSYFESRDTTQEVDFGGRMLSTSLPGDSTLAAADYVHAQAMREELHSCLMIVFL